MTSESEQQNLEAFEESVEGLRRAKVSPSEPAGFWKEFLQAAGGVLGAIVGIAALKRTSPDSDTGEWRPIAIAPENLAATPVARSLIENLDAAGAKCSEHGYSSKDVGSGNSLVAVRIDTGSPQELCIAAFSVKKQPGPELDECLERLLLIADTPRLYQINRIASESTAHVEHFSGVLDLLVLVNAEDRFMAGAMVLCNELASRHKCERVSLGWYEKGYVRVKAMSHVENFERKMEAVQILETVMEEAFDQDEEIILPRAEDTGTVVRDHETFLSEQGGTHICTMPLRIDGEAIAVCTCERSSEPFTEREVRLLRLSCDHVTRRLADLKRYDRWFGAKLGLYAKEKIEPYLGPEHTWTKVIAASIAILLGIFCFARIPYRVEAPFILRTDDVAYLTTPFDGHIDRVHVRVGDRVRRGAVMLTLDRSDLLLEEAAANAEKNRYERESEKSRAKGALADMRIANALGQQSAARLALIRHRLALSSIRAPLAGMVVEGDLMERTGAPVRQGDVLFKLAKIRRVYAELDVDEKDVHQVQFGAPGKVAFASRPQDSFDIRLVRVEPVAIPKEDGNTFIVRCELTGERQDWWRPGMTGVAKVNAGKRTPLWIVTHRTIDFLRLRLWW